MSDVSKRRQPRDGKRAIIYTRQSTSREDSISIKLQTEECERFCQQHDYRIVASGAPVSDPGVSGLQFEKRPGIVKAIELIEGGQADVLVVFRWTRLSRKRMHQAIIMARIEEAGGRVESATEPIDTTTAGGRFSREVLLAMAAFESDQKSEDWRQAQASRIARGLPAGGAPPLGYAPDCGPAGCMGDKCQHKNRPPITAEVYGPVVREMYDAFLRGIGPAGIAKSLNRRGLSTPRGKSFTLSTIIRALDSGFAAGYIMRHGERIRGAHDPLIDDATWQAYLEERDRRRLRNPNPKSRQPRWFLGAGLAVCGRCDGHLVVDSYGSKKSQAACSTYRNRPGTCEGGWVDRVKLETMVAIWLGGHVEEWANAAEAQAGIVDDERVRLVRAIDVERTEEAKLRDGLRRAARLVATGDMTDEDYGAAKRAADAELREVTQRAGDLRSRLDALDPAGDAYARLARALGRQNGAPEADRPVDIAVPVAADFSIENIVIDTTPTEREALERGDVKSTTLGTTMPPEEWHDLLRRIIRRVVVNHRSIVIEPWNGEATTYERAVVLRPRKRTDVQVRDGAGRFVKTSA